MCNREEQGTQVGGCCDQSPWLKQPRECGDPNARSRILLSGHKKSNLESGGGFTGVQRARSDFQTFKVNGSNDNEAKASGH